MKTKLIIILMLTFIYGHAQQQPPPKELSAGDYLIKAGKQKNTAIAIFFTGSLLAGVSSGTSEDATAPLMIGGISFLTAMLFEISSNENLKKAGRKLNDGLTFSGNGIIYKF